jgi:membrane glycosyltransferase
MQFVTRLYGPLFAAGANFWQLGSGNFWGHNAIIRLRPFMKHCAMPELPRTSPLGTRILSHDTIEAAFMRRAGYSVWSAYDLPGSYEECPPHLLASLQRDRRWCFGNLQHIWFLFARGLKWASRVHILNGIMAYASSPLWLLLLLLGTVSVFNGHPKSDPQAEGLLFREAQAGLLFAYVMALLLLPKALATMLLFRSPEKLNAFGGRAKVILSALGETLFSMILAPILMLFYTRFVRESLTGARVQWGRQKREADEAPSWRELASAHLGHTSFVLAWAGLVAWLKPSFLPWMALVFFGPIVSIPFSRLTASIKLGQRARRKGWFAIPEESQPPLELRQVQEPFSVPASPFFQTREYARDYGLLQAILDPYMNAVHVSLLRQRPQASIRTREYMNALSERLLLDGPFTLTPQEKRTLLWDADAMMGLHEKLWSRPASHLHEWWQAAFRHYNESIALSVRRTVSAL